MRAVKWKGGLVLLAAALLLAWWWRGASSPGQPEAPVAESPLPDVAPGVPAQPVAAGPVGTLPGIVPPPIESATPAERAAMVDAEVERSAATAPVATYTGEDGRQKKFNYEQDPVQENAQRAADARRAAVLEEMRADPANFAARHKLRPREVELMLDGSMEVPENLLH